VGEWLIAKAALRSGWVLPVITLVAWIAMLMIGSHNNPNGGDLLFLSVGCPAFLAWGTGLFLGWSGATGKEK